MKFGVVRVSLCAAPFLIAAAMAARLRLDDDVARLLPDGDPRVVRAVAFARALGERLAVEVSCVDAPGVEADAVWRVADRIVAAAAEHGVRESIAEPADILAVIAAVRAAAPGLVSADAWDSHRARLEPAAVRAALERWTVRLQEADGLALAEAAVADPLGFTDDLMGALIGLQPVPMAVQLRRGRLTLDEGRTALVVLEPGFPASDVEQSFALLETIRSAAAEDSSGVAVKAVGAHRAMVENARRIRRDVAITAALGGALAALFSLLVHARARYALLALLPPFGGALVAAGLFAVTRGTISSAAAGCGAALIGLTVDYANHALFALRAHGAVDRKALFASAATSAGAFGALGASELPAVREIGMFSMIGTVGAALVAAYIVPALAGDVRSAQPRFDLPAFVRRARRSRTVRLAALLVLAAIPLAAWGTTRLRLDGDLRRLDGIGTAATADETAVRARWSFGSDLVWIAATGADQDAALDANDRVAAALTEPALAKFVETVHSVAHFLPGPVERTRRAAAARAFWDPVRVEALRATFREAAKATPFRAEAFEPLFTRLAAPSPEPVLSAAAAPMRERVMRIGGETVVATAVRLRHAGEAAEFGRRLEEVEGAATLADGAALGRRLADAARSEGWWMVALALGAATLLMRIALGGGAATSAAAAAAFCGVLGAAGLLGLCGIALDLVTAPFAAFAVGAAADYALAATHGRLAAFRGNEGSADAYDAATLLNVVAASAGFSSLAAAEHPALRGLGVVAATGIVAAYAFAQTVAATLCRATLRKHGPGGVPSWRHIVATVWLLAALLAATLPTRRRGPKHLRRAALDRIRDAGLKLRRSLPLGVRTYFGEDAVRLLDKCIVVANHGSHYDGLAIAALPKDVVAFVKPYVLRLPFAGRLVRDAGYVAVGSLRIEELVARCRDVFEVGAIPVFYPEGTRSHAGRLERFRRGAFTLARALDVPVVPVALVDTRQAMRPGTWWVGDHDVSLAVLDPVHPREFPGENGDRMFARAVRTRLASAIRARRREMVDGTVWQRRVVSAYAAVGAAPLAHARDAVRSDGLLAAIARLAPSELPVHVFGAGEGRVLVRLLDADPERAVYGYESDAAAAVIARAAVPEDAKCEVLLGSDRLGPPGSVVLDAASSAGPPPPALLALVAAGGVLVVRADASGRGFPNAEAWSTLLTASGFEMVPISELPSLGFIVFQPARGEPRATL